MALAYSKILFFGIFLVIGGAAATMQLIIPALNGNTPNAGSGDTANDLRRIIDFDSFQWVRLSSSDGSQGQEMAVNSRLRFLDPFGKSMQRFEEQNINTATQDEREAFIRDADAQEYYQLIRLTEWLGGNANDISAYRAYSSLDISSHCSVKYWPTAGRMDIEDPCHSNHYRAWDGLAYVGISSFGSSGGSAMLFTSDFLALPQIRLAIDSEGYLAAYKPDNTLFGDGVVGEGRRFSQDNLEQSNQKMIDTVVVGQKIKIPAEILPGYNLIWVSPFGEYSQFGHTIEGLMSAEQSTAIVAAYRQKSSQQYYDYALTVFPISSTNDLSLTGDKGNHETNAEQIFNKTFGPFVCYEPQECTFEPRTVDEDAGNYALIKTQHVSDLTRGDRDMDETYGRALVWLDDSFHGDSAIQYLIVLEAINEDMASIIQAIKGMGVAN